MADMGDGFPTGKTGLFGVLPPAILILLQAALLNNCTVPILTSRASGKQGLEQWTAHFSVGSDPEGKGQDKKKNKQNQLTHKIISRLLPCAWHEHSSVQHQQPAHLRETAYGPYTSHQHLGRRHPTC